MSGTWPGSAARRLVATAAVLAAQVARPDDAADLAQRWSRFPIFVWFHGGPQPGPRAFAVLKSHGLSGCNVEGSDSSDAAAAAGMDFYVDHVAGKGDLYLRPERFDADRDKLKRDRLALRPVRPNCFNDPDVMQRLKKLVAENVKRHASHAPLAWVLDDELSVTRGVNPMDYCFGEECLRGLRESLRREYGTIERLDAAWGAKWRAFSEVVPPTTEETRRANAGRPIEQANFTGWNDHRAFMSASFARGVHELAAWIERCGGRGPAGFTGGEFPSAFGGFECEELVRGCSLVEVYEAGVAPELARGLLPGGGKLVSTLFVPESEKARASWSPWEVLARAARGDDGAVVWASGAIYDAAGGELNEAGRRLAAAAAAAARMKQLLFEAAAVPAAAPVALFESAASVRGAWMVDSWQDGATWPNRLTSYEADHSSSATSREGWATLLRAASLPFRFVGPDDVVSPSLAESGVRCVVLHEAVALADREIDALEAFVRLGGLLVADEHALFFDERLRGRDGKALARLFDVRRPGGATLEQLSKEFDGDTAPGVGSAMAELGHERTLGRGTTLHLGRRLAGATDDARRRAELLALAPKLREWFSSRGVGSSPRLPFEAAERLRLHRWRDGERAVGTQRRVELAIVVAVAPAGAPVKSELVFDEAVRVEWLEPPRPGIVEVAAGARVPLEVDDLHPAIVRWSAAD